MSWVYGLVEIEEKGEKGSISRRTELCEVYLRESKNGRIKSCFGCAPVDWKGVRRDRKMILEDLKAQQEMNIKFSLGLNGKMKARKGRK